MTRDKVNSSLEATHDIYTRGVNQTTEVLVIIVDGTKIAVFDLYELAVNRVRGINLQPPKFFTATFTVASQSVAEESSRWTDNISVESLRTSGLSFVENRVDTGKEVIKDVEGAVEKIHKLAEKKDIEIDTYLANLNLER